MLFIPIQEIIHISSFFLGGPADLTGPFAGMKTGCLVLQSLYFFFRSNVNIIFDGFTDRPLVYIISRLLLYASVWLLFLFHIHLQYLPALDALTFEPSNFTLPVSHATAASVLVLKRRMAQRYLSRRNFSFSAMITILLQN